MTCIIGLSENGSAWVGADSAAVDSWTIRPARGKKVFRVGQYVIGYTDSFRMGQILEHQINYPPCEEPSQDFMVKEFIEKVRKGLIDYGYTKIDSNQETAGTFVVGVMGKVFEIDSDLQVNEPLDGLVAVGSGFPFALGVMKALESLHPKFRIEKALEISSYYNGRCMPPFNILEV